MATTSRNRFTSQERQRYLEQFERSGLTQAEFCRRAKLHPATLSVWRSKLKSASAVFAEVQVSTPVSVPASEASVLGVGAVLHLPEGAKLEVALGGDAAWAGLGLMLKTLQS